ncbi:MAG: autotransporter outer membrane beta-barrel domain-containing protein, partial [Pseudomonadota bacterium]
QAVSHDTYSSPYAYAAGIYLRRSIQSENSGTITIAKTGVVQARAQNDGYATADGIFAGTTFTGAIENNGLISAEADGVYSAYAYGIDTDHLNGSISNAGTISAMAEATYYYASAYGIQVGTLGAEGQINVSGLIEAKASTDFSEANAYAIYVGNNGADMAGDIFVSGTIDAQAVSHDSYSNAYAAGIYLRWNDETENSGTITIAKTGVVQARGENNSRYATATGIYAGTYFTGAIENNGLISAEADGADYAYAYGIDMYHLDGSILNAGRIQVEAGPVNYSASAYGINIGSVGVNGTVTNSGYIDVHVGDSSYAAGVSIAYGNGMAGHFTNTGSIVATRANDVGTALFVGGDGGLVTLNTKGFIIGDIYLRGDINLNVQGDMGRSVHWTVDGSGKASGDFNVNDEGYRGTAVFKRQTDGGMYEFATLDSSGPIAMRQASADAGFIGLDALVAKTSAAANPVKAADGTGGTHLMPFITAASQSRTYIVDGSLDQDVSTSSVSFGNTMAMANGMFLGLGGGKLSGSAKVDYIDGPSSEADQHGAFVGVAISANSANLDFVGAISAGRMSFDTTRYVNDNTVFDGIVTEDASFDSTFVAAEVALSHRVDAGNGMAVVPNVTLSYARHTVDGYAESGSSAAAVVDAQTFGAFEGEMGIAVEKTIANGVLSGNFSVMTRNLTGDENVQVTMIGETNAVNAKIGSSTASKLSLGYSSSFSPSGQFNLGVETMLGSSDMSGGKISGEVRFSF